LPKWWELQDLIDDARILVYADYERYLSIRTRAVTILHDGVRKEIDLFAARGLDGLEWTLKHAVNEIEAAGGVEGYALIYANERRRELVFLAAINEAEKGICALELKRKTGDELRDLRGVTLIARLLKVWSGVGLGAKSMSKFGTISGFDLAPGAGKFSRAGMHRKKRRDNGPNVDRVSPTRFPTRANLGENKDQSNTSPAKDDVGSTNDLGKRQGTWGTSNGRQRQRLAGRKEDHSRRGSRPGCQSFGRDGRARSRRLPSWLTDPEM